MGDGAPVFDNSYARLPARFYTPVTPDVLSTAGEVVVLNDQLAAQIGIDADWLHGPEGMAMVSGAQMPAGAAPLAQVYAGHQFGAWVPRLGDGRAALLGEIVAPDGCRWDVQLKGAGQTPYSRGGDGRAWLGPVLREYIVSEAMQALGVETTRALAVVATHESIWREQLYPGAILTRVASSHIRVGTFEYFAAKQDEEALRLLLAHAIARHYTDLAPEDALGFLGRVMQAQARLVAKWMGVGFIHGVMNTDNCHIGGLSLDYGPCAFLDDYHPAKVFSSIDHMGRYAYQAQPEITVWNLAKLGSALLPLIDPCRESAIKAVRSVLHGFGAAYSAAWKEVFSAKIGRRTDEGDHIALVQELLIAMAENKADFTRTFRALSRDDGAGARDEFADPRAFDAWHRQWGGGTRRLMQNANPAFIPRNHRIAEAIAAAVSGDFTPFHQLVHVLSTPYQEQPQYAELQNAPRPDELVHHTFCGT